MLRIEEIQFEDIPLLEQMEKELYIKPWLAKDWEYELTKNPYSYYFKMLNTEQGSEFVGYIGFWILFEKAEITKVSIVKKYQGKKLSTILLEDAIKRILLANCENITLEVRVSNQTAIHLYKKFDFKIVAIRKRYYENGEDAYLMLKELKNDNISN